MSSHPPEPVPGDLPTSNPDSGEEGLVARVRAGDAHVFGALFAEHHAALCGFVLSYVNDPAVAEELVQDLFCALWRQRAEWTPQGRVRHYLLAAARNRALSWLRHRRIVDRNAWRWHGSAAQGDGLPGMGDQPARPDRSAEAAELTEACRRAIHALPERRRLVVTLRWQHQMTHAEIARVLGISVKAVEVQLSRALKSLRHHLTKFRE